MRKSHQNKRQYRNVAVSEFLILLTNGLTLDNIQVTRSKTNVPTARRESNNSHSKADNPQLAAKRQSIWTDHYIRTGGQARGLQNGC